MPQTTEHIPKVCGVAILQPQASLLLPPIRVERSCYTANLKCKTANYKPKQTLLIPKALSHGCSSFKDTGTPRLQRLLLQSFLGRCCSGRASDFGRSALSWPVLTTPEIQVLLQSLSQSPSSGTLPVGPHQEVAQLWGGSPPTAGCPLLFLEQKSPG